MPRGERRVRRTSNKKQAIIHFLESCMRRQGLRALVVGDKDGLVLAGAGDGVDHEAAAAYAPFVFQKKWKYPDPLKDRFFIDVIPLPETHLYLFALGSDQIKGKNAASTKSGIRRIMDEAA